LIARRLYQAQAAAAQAVTNDVQLDAVLTYLDLVRVYSALAINADTLARAEEMLRLSQSAEKEGLGVPWMVNRSLTEVDARRTERIDLTGQAAAVAARLARLLLLDPAVQLQPAAPPVVPVTIVPEDSPLDKLIALGVDNRPEVRESRLLTDAARVRRQQATVAPFLPALQANYAAGIFGGGHNDLMTNFDGRGDGTVMAVWQLHNLGAGDAAIVRTRRAEQEQAAYHVTEVQAEVASQVVEAARLSIARHAALTPAEDAVRQGIDLWARLRRYVVEIGFPARQYNPLDLLIAEQQLDQARLLYLAQVIEYNKAQFRLYWAMGQPPLCALPQATALPVQEPVVPPTYQPAPLPGRAPEVPPAPRPVDKKE
jgi:outer membrane protein TolC